MPTESEQSVSINSWLEEEIYQQYIHNRGGIDESWKQRFDSEAAKPAETPVEQPAPPLVTQEVAPVERAEPAERPAVTAVTAPKPAAVAPPQIGRAHV